MTIHIQMCIRDRSRTFEELKRLHVTGVDMESACMLTVGRLMGVKTCVVTMTTVLENLKKVLEGQERTDAEDLDVYKRQRLRYPRG